MRYNLSCEQYAIDAKLNSDLLQDPVVLAGRERAEIAARVAELQKRRWNFCSPTLNGGDQAKIVIIDQAAFDANCKDEVAEVQELQKLNAIFQKLNPLFAEVQKKYSFILSPTLTGLQQLKKSSIEKAETFKRRIKDKVAQICDSEILSKGKSLDEILLRPDVIAMQKENNEYIKIEEAKIKDYDHYINQIKQILKGDD
jgi:hypothetical protein